MTLQHIIVLIAVIFFIIPFVVWTIVRFRTNVLQRYATWHKLALISSFALCSSIFVILLTLALTVFN